MKSIQIKIHPFLGQSATEDLAKKITVLVLKYCSEQGIILKKKPRIVVRL